MRIVAGDPDYWNSAYRIAAEGVLIVDGTPSSSAQWIEGTATVTVTDGRLTVTSAAGAINNKIAFIEITQTSIAVGTAAYYPFGEVRASTGIFDTERGFTGQIADPGTGLNPFGFAQCMLVTTPATRTRCWEGSSARTASCRTRQIRRTSIDTHMCLIAHFCTQIPRGTLSIT